MGDVKTVRSGSKESGDLIIEITPADRTEIEIESTVKALYGKAILKTVEDYLKEHDVKPIHVKIDDNGARDYVIKARLTAVLKKAAKEGMEL